MTNDARPPAARDRGVDHVSAEEGAFVFPWEKKVEEQCLERRFSVIIYFSLKCIQTVLHRT